MKNNKKTTFYHCRFRNEELAWSSEKNFWLEIIWWEIIIITRISFSNKKIAVFFVSLLPFAKSQQSGSILVIFFEMT